MAASLAFNDIYPGGAILKRVYGKRRFSLYLWHFAYNGGNPIELARVKSEGALDMATAFWGNRLEKGWLPPHIKGVDGKLWERRWFTLALNNPTPDQPDKNIQQ